MDMGAVDWRPAAVYVEAGGAERGSAVAGAGARWPARWQASGLGGRFVLGLEVAVHRWSARREAGDRQGSVQFTATPVVRWHGEGGASPWFLEAGIGLSYQHRAYEARGAHQSTRWNFNDVLGLGRRDGPHEVSLRLTHFSNAGLRKPNPGDSSLSLRWGYLY